MKTSFGSFALLLVSLSLGAQVPLDTNAKTIALSEVCVMEHGDPASQAFNFYKSSKLANTEDILSRMSGVNLIKRGAYGLEPGIRNYSGGQTNLTIDGMRIYGACTDKMDPVSIYIEPVNLQEIQVNHGAAGALNGSTVGGQINFNLRDPSYSCSRKVHGQFSQSYATVNQGYNTTGALEKNFKRFSVRVSGAKRDASDYHAGSGLLINNSAYHKYNFAGVLGFKIDSTQTLRFNYLGDWGKNIGYPALLMDVGSAKAQLFSLTHQRQFSSKYWQTHEAKVYYNAIFHQMDDTHRSNVPMHMDMPGWSKTIGAFENISMKKGLSMRVDGHYSQTRADMIMYPSGEPVMYLQTLPENTFLDIGMAARYELKLKKRQQVTINGRLDFLQQQALNGPGVNQWQVFNTDITKVKYDLLKNFGVQYGKNLGASFYSQVLIAMGSRVATANERYGYYLFNRQDQFDYIGNLDLKPEVSYQAEWLTRFTKKHVECSVNLFYHQIKDYIYSYRLAGYGPMTIGALGLKTYTNIPYATSSGGEFTFKGSLNEHFTYMGSAKYVYAFTNTGSPLPLVPPFKLQQSLRYNIELWQLQLEYDYAAAQSRINKDYGDKATPDFHLFNFRISRNVKLGPGILQLSAACENIADVRYREHLDIGQVPRFGRSFNFNLSYIF